MRTNYLGGRSHAHTNSTPTLNFLPFTLLAVLLGLLHAPLPALAQSNITVENTDTSSILYSGVWEPLPGDLDSGRSHSLTSDPTALAVFEFSGTAIYFLAPLWPYVLTTGISLDGAPADTLNLQDPASVGDPSPVTAGETVASAVVWSRTGLLDTLHTLTISVVPDPSGAQSFAVVDALIYTSDIALPPSTPSAPSTPIIQSTPGASSTTLSLISLQPSTTGASAASSRDTHQNKTGLSIALGIVLTVVGLILLYALRWAWRRRQLARQEAARAAAFDVPPPSDAPDMAQAGGHRRSAYASIRPRSQRELAAAAAAAAAREEEEEERERERERERRRRRPARGPSGLRHSTVLGSDVEGDADTDGSGSGSGSVRRKRSAGPGDAVLGTIPERRESYVGGGAGAGAGDASDPPWREVDGASRYPRGHPRT